MNKVIGYVGNGKLKDIAEADVKALDGINIAFGTITGNKINWDKEKYKEDIARIKSINPNIKVLLSVGGWGCGGFSDMAITAEGRAEFAKDCYDVVEYAGLDGIDLDWEYPTMNSAGIDARPEDKQTFTQLLQAIRDELSKCSEYKMVTIAAGCSKNYINAVEIEKITPILDYIQIMTYDQGDAYIKFTGHHTNLHDYAKSKSSASTYINNFIEAGVPANKIVMGAAFYSRRWKGVTNVNNGYRQEADTIGDFGPDYGELVENYVDKNGFVRYWDNDAKAPYLFDGNDFISYDDKESISEKIKYLKEKGLYGIMYWEYKCDSTMELTQYMKAEITK